MTNLQMIYIIIFTILGYATVLAAINLHVIIAFFKKK